MDQRKSLRKMIAAEMATSAESISDSQLSEFKIAVTRVLSPQASAILLDPEYGLEAARHRAANCGLLMTYEVDGFENPRPNRMLALMPRISVRRLHDLGAEAIKILLSYSPSDNETVNDEKRALIERIGSECDSLAMPFLLEPVVYGAAGLDPQGFDFARIRPEMVVRTMEEFSKPVYRVDVLKVEFPVNVSFVEESKVYAGRAAHTRAEALAWYRAAASVARVPYIYLSAGVNNAHFVASLGLASEAGARYSGVLCGRANWQGGVARYASGGVEALTAWLMDEGTRNMRSVNECLQAATPWTEWLENSLSVEAPLA